MVTDANGLAMGAVAAARSQEAPLGLPESTALAAKAEEGSGRYALVVALDAEGPEQARESVAGLAGTRPYDLGRHTHSALMLASGMSLQRLARIQGHSIRVLDETYSEELAEFSERAERIDPVAEIEKARSLVWGDLDPSSGNKR